MMVLPAVEARPEPLLVGVDPHLPGVPGARDPQDQATLVGAMGIQDTEDRDLQDRVLPTVTGAHQGPPSPTDRAIQGSSRATDPLHTTEDTLLHRGIRGTQEVPIMARGVLRPLLASMRAPLHPCGRPLCPQSVNRDSQADLQNRRADDLLATTVVLAAPNRA